MLRSLVGSEMYIRDRCGTRPAGPIAHCAHPEGCAGERAQRANHAHSAVLGPQGRSLIARIPKGAPMSGHHQLPGTTLRERTAAAVADDRLRANVARAVDRFASHRLTGLAELDDADALRGAARAAKQQVLADLPALLERFADRVVASGG